MKDFWNQRYLEEGLAYGEEANDFLKDNWNLISPSGKILCLSEGEGRNAIFLAKLGFDVTAIDISSVGLDKASARARSEQVKLTTEVADLNDYEMGENKWDAVISIFGHLPKDIRIKVHSNVMRSLKFKGIYLLEAYTPEQLLLKTGGPKECSMMLDLSNIDSELTLLEPIIKRTCIREIREGKYHQGLSAVVQYVGKKKIAF
jgi:SAM-dependent methyltransferase